MQVASGIKSSNVLLDGFGRAYLGDFELALFVDHEKVTRELGTWPPEMAYVSEATKEPDVYSFGVLMLEVMYGKRTLDTSAIERGEGMLVDRVCRAHEAGNILQTADPFLMPPDAKDSASHMGEIQLQEVSLICRVAMIYI